MNNITLMTRHLKRDERALYKDIFVDGRSLQETLKEHYPEQFGVGRYREEFVARLNSPRHPFAQSIVTGNSAILPIYGCQDGCCIYVYALVQRLETIVRWADIAQDSYYFGDQKSEGHALQWLSLTSALHFPKVGYEQLFTTTVNN